MSVLPTQRDAGALKFAGLIVLVAAIQTSWLSPPAQAAWPHNPYSGNVTVCGATGLQDSPGACSDGAGCVIVTWEDGRAGGGNKIYGQRISAAGVALWTPDGVALCPAGTNDENVPVVVSDGAGGAIVAWQDLRTGTNYDIYAQRVGPTGLLIWGTAGVGLCTQINGQFSPTICSDGAGGAIVAWVDSRSGDEIYGTRVTAAGSPNWTPNGVPICAFTGNQESPKVAPDGAGGALVVWADYRSGGFSDVYAQRLTSGGAAQWTSNGVGVCTFTGDQYNGHIVPTSGAVRSSSGTTPAMGAPTSTFTLNP